jgi:hypothetical protein
LKRKKTGFQQSTPAGKQYESAADFSGALAMSVARPDIGKIRRSLRLLCQSCEVYELRAPNTRKATVFAYFDDLKAFASRVVECSDQLEPPGIYLTMNPVRRELLSRASISPEYCARYAAADADIPGSNVPSRTAAP